MRANNKEPPRPRLNDESEKPLFLWRRCCLVVAALWLQIVVIVFIGIEMQHRVNTPIAQWWSKVIHLLLGL